jgi:acetyl-CoA carboxylase biotin carboxyl carrier protein
VRKKTSKSGAGVTTSADLSLIRQLADILNSTGLTDIELDQGSSRIRVSKTPATAQTYLAPAPSAAMISTPMPVAMPTAIGMATADPAANLKSPMVGTAYLASSPGAPEFAAVGATVKQGQTVLIIEAMKTMNQIPAHRSGKVIEVRVEGGQPVEFGEVLMVIE